MSRPLRIEYPDAWYHIMNRGRRGEIIFEDRKDYLMFLEVLQESIVLFDCRFAAFCLMPNHYHILVQTPQGNVSRVMRHVNGVYTQRFNRRHDYDGQLFRGRFKSVLVEGDSHLLEVLRYIHRNPVRAEISESVAKYPWSSHSAYVSTTGKQAWVDTEFLLSMFSETPSKARNRYRKFVKNEEPKEIRNFFGKKNLPAIMGTRDFIEGVRADFYDAKKHSEVPQLKDLAPTIDDIKKWVSHSYRISRKKLETTRRGQENTPRNVAIYLARMHSGLALEEIGKNFGNIKYSSVSNIVRKVKSELADNPKLSQKIASIQRKLQIEQ